MAMLSAIFAGTEGLGFMWGTQTKQSQVSSPQCLAMPFGPLRATTGVMATGVKPWPFSRQQQVVMVTDGRVFCVLGERPVSTAGLAPIHGETEILNRKRK